LGRLSPEQFLGGEMRLDRNAAETALRERLGAPLGVTLERAASGMLQVATSAMANAVRHVTLERGLDPRDFTLVAYGGGGPLHAASVAKELSIRTIIIPHAPGHFSALGMLMADVRQDYVRTYYRPLEEADFAALASIHAELAAAGDAALAAAGIDSAARSFELALDLRYVGQEFWLPIPVTEAELRGAEAQAIARRFAEIHDRRFGHAATDEPLELVNVRLTAIGARPRIEFPPLQRVAAQAAIGRRAVYLESAAQPTSCAVYRRERLDPGAALTGPAVIEEYASTTVLFEGDALTVASTAELVIEIGER
jgi:N-methylhydantoinase A